MVCDKGQVIAPGKVSVLASSITYPYLTYLHVTHGSGVQCSRSGSMWARILGQSVSWWTSISTYTMDGPL